MPLIDPNPGDPNNRRYAIAIICAVVFVAAVFVFIGT